MNKLLVFLVCLAIGSSSLAAQAPDGVADDSVGLTAPTENVDGTILTDLDYLTLHWGFAPGSYVDNVLIIDVNEGETVQQPVTIQLVGDYGDTVQVCFAGTATDAQGNTSAFSSEVCRDYLIVDNTTPNPPTVFFTVPISYDVRTPSGEAAGVVALGG